MHAASRDALVNSTAFLDAAISEAPEGAIGAAAQIGAELFEVVDSLEAERGLRVALADTSAAGTRRRALADEVFAGKVSATTLRVLGDAVAQDWSNPRELRDGLVELGRSALLRAASEQGQLETVEDELFRLGRIVAQNGGFEQALADRSAPIAARRELLSAVLYGKVTAVTEALAMQAVTRPEARPADDFDALSRLAASRRGRTVAHVTSASPLSDEQRGRLERSLGSVYGREIAVHTDLDAALMGGVVIRVGDEIIDGSTAARLDAVRRHFR